MTSVSVGLTTFLSTLSLFSVNPSTLQTTPVRTSSNEHRMTSLHALSTKSPTVPRASTAVTSSQNRPSPSALSFGDSSGVTAPFPDDRRRFRDLPRPAGASLISTRIRPSSTRLRAAIAPLCARSLALGGDEVCHIHIRTCPYRRVLL